MGIITCRVSLDLKNDSNWKVNIRMYHSSGVTEQKLLPEAETTLLYNRRNNILKQCNILVWVLFITSEVGLNI